MKQPLLKINPGDLLKLISRLDSLDSDDYKNKVADKYPKLVEGSGVRKASYCIALKDDAKPFPVPVPRKVSFPLYQQTKEELDRNVGGRCHIQS